MAGKRKRTDAATDAGKTKKSKSGPPKREREEPSALPEPLETPEDVAEETTTPKKNSKKEKKSPKKAKTEKTAKSEQSNGEVEEKPEEEVNGAKEESTPSSKSKKNKKKNKNEVAEGAEGDADAADGKKAKAPRFIVFVGNLPYTANAATIRQHFASVKPSTVRCLQKDGQENTCRGFAFIEFSDPSNMRTCLDKLHHSVFNDGLSQPRKINVELTAGGGGSKSNRKEKIKARNAQLEVNRAKRIQKEQEEKKANATGEPADDGGMHPSRKARMA